MHERLERKRKHTQGRAFFLSAHTKSRPARESVTVFHAAGSNRTTSYDSTCDGSFECPRGNGIVKKLRISSIFQIPKLFSDKTFRSFSSTKLSRPRDVSSVGILSACINDRTVRSKSPPDAVAADTNILCSPSPSGVRSRPESLNLRHSGSVFDGQAERLSPMQDHKLPLSSTATGKQNRGITHQISQKLAVHSNTSAIVHHPNLGVRQSVPFSTPPKEESPSFLSLNGRPDESCVVTSREQSSLSPATVPTNTMPSSFSAFTVNPLGGLNSHSLSSIQETTSDSSITTAIPDLSPSQKGTRNNWSTSMWFPPHLGCESFRPSISTIENTASVKVFLETHFNSLMFANGSPRSVRRREFEAYLLQQPLSEEERQAFREDWFREESFHLRKCRALKARSNIRKFSKGVLLPGYEAIRVLGKGSFGLVRLVKEAASTSSSTSIKTIDESCHLVNEGPSNQPLTLTEKSSISPGTSGRLYAMKVIRKSDMLRNSQEAHLRAERDFLVASENSEWIVPLVASFQDNGNLYLVMDYMVGGDFLGLLLREDVLDETVTKWYIAEMILCVEEAHRMKWIHRDIKPDNFLISSSGHLKISDFGLAFDGHWTHSQYYFNEQRYELLDRFGISVRGDDQDAEDDAAKTRIRRSLDSYSDSLRSTGRLYDSKRSAPTKLDWLNARHRRTFARSIVGTSQYMAPEVIRADCYDGRCDWWSVGIILYECLYGCTPFFCENRNLTKQRILEHHATLAFPDKPRIARPGDPRGGFCLPKVSTTAMDLIYKLLQEKESRLSSLKYRENDLRSEKSVLRRYHSRTALLAGFVFPDDAEDIKAHDFFRDIEWKKIHRQCPPFVPRIEDDIAKYFDDERDILSDSDMVDSSAFSDLEDSQAKTHTEQANDTNSCIGLDSQYRRWNAAKQGEEAVATPAYAAKLSKRMMRRPVEKKRPRDKLLRDPTVGKEVLDLRKKGAFIGYTYKRPSTLADCGEVMMVKGRLASARPKTGDIYGG